MIQILFISIQYFIRFSSKFIIRLMIIIERLNSRYSIIYLIILRYFIIKININYTKIIKQNKNNNIKITIITNIITNALAFQLLLEKFSHLQQIQIRLVMLIISGVSCSRIAIVFYIYLSQIKEKRRARDCCGTLVELIYYNLEIYLQCYSRSI